MDYISIIDWIDQHKIKNEKGDPIEFTQHLFLYDIYLDQAQYMCVMKPAQVGLTTLEVLKNLYDAYRYKMDIIYTLPTDEDVSIMVGGKVNRIITQNPVLLEYTKDKDSIEQKSVGNSMLYFRGTFTKKSATMVTADRLVHDEKDSSKQDVVKDYEARLQHSKFKQKHVFSHPSTPNSGVDVEWNESDQKEWFIECPHCHEHQYLSWDTGNLKNMSIDIDREVFICKMCHKELTDTSRAIGQWVPRVFTDKEGKPIKKKYSGYHISLLMASWVTAAEIVAKYKDPNVTEEFFFNKVLGLPYIGAGNKLTFGHISQNLTETTIAPEANEFMVMGIDTGLKLDCVMGGKSGLFYHGEAKGYDELDRQMRLWPKAIAVIDAGGDLISCREFVARWQGRVYLCYTNGSAKNDNPVWDEAAFSVTVERNKWIQLVVDEFRERRIPIMGKESDWYDYWTDWNNLSRIKVVDSVTGQSKGYKWVRSGRDHRALATVYWRIGMDRFQDISVTFSGQNSDFASAGIEANPDGLSMMFPRISQ